MGTVRRALVALLWDGAGEVDPGCAACGVGQCARAGSGCELLSPLPPGDFVSWCPLQSEELHYCPAQVQHTTSPLQGSLLNYLHYLVPALPPCLEPFSPLRNLSGQLEISGDIYLDTFVHADIAEVLKALTALAACSVDLTSLSVEGKNSSCAWQGLPPVLLTLHLCLASSGAKLELQVYPFSFLITNRHFSEDLLDPFATVHQELTRGLGDVVGVAGGRGPGSSEGAEDHCFGVVPISPSMPVPWLIPTEDTC